MKHDVVGKVYRKYSSGNKTRGFFNESVYQPIYAQNKHKSRFSGAVFATFETFPGFEILNLRNQAEAPTVYKIRGRMGVHKHVFGGGSKESHFTLIGHFLRKFQ